MDSENEFSSTMRIDIPPDLAGAVQPAGTRVETTKLRIRPTPPKTRKFKIADASATKYEQLLQSIYDAALITDLSGRITDSNGRACEFLLFTRDELNRLTIPDIISGADKSLLDTLCQNLQNEKYALLQAYCIRKDDSYFPAEIAVNAIKFEEGTKLCFFVRDVTLRRQAEEMLRTEHNALQNAATGIAIVNIHARVEYANPALVAMWQFDSGDTVLGTDLRRLFKDKDAAEQFVRTVLTDHQPWSGELAASRNDGTEFSAQVAATCNRDTDGNVVGMVVSFVDISDRKRAEEATRQTERQRVMLASVGAACHHLGQPATVIMANIELIKRMTKDLNNDELKDLLHLTNEAVNTLAEVLHKLNSVNEFRTVQYLEAQDAGSPENVILDI